MSILTLNKVGYPLQLEEGHQIDGTMVISENPFIGCIKVISRGLIERGIIIKHINEDGEVIHRDFINSDSLDLIVQFLKV